MWGAAPPGAPPSTRLGPPLPRGLAPPPPPPPWLPPPAPTGSALAVRGATGWRTGTPPPGLHALALLRHNMSSEEEDERHPSDALILREHARRHAGASPQPGEDGPPAEGQDRQHAARRKRRKRRRRSSSPAAVQPADGTEVPEEEPSDSEAQPALPPGAQDAAEPSPAARPAPVGVTVIPDDAPDGSNAQMQRLLRAPRCVLEIKACPLPEHRV